MIQVCDLPRQRQVRRLSAEEFFTLVRCGGAGFYRPCSEVLRMLTAGEAWGTAGAALLVLPLTADTAAAAALRSWLGRRQLEGGCLLTPPVGTGTELPARLVEVAAARADVKFKLFHIPSVSILRGHNANDNAFRFRSRQRRKSGQQ